MNLLARTSLGFGFGVLAVVGLGYIAETTPVVVAIQEPAGITASGYREGVAKARPSYVSIYVAKARAQGGTGWYGDTAFVMPAVPVTSTAGRGEAIGEAEAQTRARYVVTSCGAAKPTAAGTVEAVAKMIQLRVGQIEASAGAYVKISSVGTNIGTGAGSAKGIQNPTDEELLLILRRVRSIRRV